MSQNLEKIFKESLQNTEAPYKPEAWDALQARLDSALPVTAPKRSYNLLKASSIAIGVVGIFTALYFLSSYPSSEARNNDKNITQNLQSNPKTNEKYTQNISAESKDAEFTSTELSVSKSVKTTSEIKTELKPTNSLKKTDDFTDMSDLALHSAPKVQTNTKEPKIGETVTFISLPLISNKCVGEEISINNSNTKNIVVYFPSGKKKTILAKKNEILKLNEEGTYGIQDDLGENENSFVVHSSSEPDFEIDIDNIYKNGVPSTAVRTNSIADNYKWTSNGRNKAIYGKENEFHFFESGIHTVELEITDNNGCKNSASKTVHVANDYNLMAVDAFSPLSMDTRRNTFMPYALKERNTGFTLVIIDPKDGGVVYQTRDASAGWDGIDRRTGNQAGNGANFIWKVVLTNPIPGETDSYKGIILVKN